MKTENPNKDNDNVIRCRKYHHHRRRLRLVVKFFFVVCYFCCSIIQNSFVNASSQNWGGTGQQQQQQQQQQQGISQNVKHSIPSHDRPSHRWLQQGNENKKLLLPQQQSLSFSLLFDSFRGGDESDSSSKALVVPSSSSSNSPTILEPEIFQQEEQNNDNNKITTTTQKISSALQSTSDSIRKIRRTQLITLILLRFVFLLLLPLSTLLLAITLASSAFLTTLRILTLTLCFTDMSKIINAIMRATLALLLACITGIFSPPFAIFGLLAAFSLSLVDMTEPVIRLKYKREMKKMVHLHKLINDPVLLESLGVIMRSARTIAVIGGKVVEETGEKIGRSAVVSSSSSSKRITDGGVDGNAVVDTSEEENKGEKKKKGVLRLFQRAPKTTTTATTTVKVLTTTTEPLDEQASHELVETLLSSPEAIKAKTRVVKRLPQPVVKWMKEQFQSIRDSGVLEVAASRALAALQRELAGAVEFMPYLEAIERVRTEQVQLKTKKSAAAEEEEESFKKRWW